MPIFFKDVLEDIQFKFYDSLPDSTMVLRIKGESAYRLNVKAFHLYGMYKNGIYDSYKQKPDLAKDIKERKNEYQEKPNSKLNQCYLYKDPLHHYSVATSLGAMQEWRDSKRKIKCYLAYQNKNHRKTTIGFVHFTEQTVDEKPIVYIAEACVLNRGKSIGRHLMECVLSHYPAGTEFYILTRTFNTEAKNLYEKRLGFTSITESQIHQLGYDNRYCGFKHTTSVEEISAIRANQNNKKMVLKIDPSAVNNEEEKHADPLACAKSYLMSTPKGR